jgi:hypothetical protein
MTAWTSLSAELLSLLLRCCSITSINTWRDICFHLWLSCSWFTPKEEEEKEKRTQLTPHALRADGHVAEGVTINVILKSVLFYDDISG